MKDVLKFLCRKVSAVCFFVFLGLFPLEAAEIIAGRVKLALHENTGRFSLYGLNQEEVFEPFFSAQDPRTSFAVVSVDDKIYRLGESGAFRFRLDEETSPPSFVFESPFLSVRQEFSFVRTAGSPDINGIEINFRLKNTRPREINAGLRLLFDTQLGEGGGKIPFYADGGGIVSETLMESATVAGDLAGRWVSRKNDFALMGSGSSARGKSPDALYFANWKRLNEAPWKPLYVKGRNFNYLPYSIGDSAVCYYFDPVPLLPEQELSYTIALAAEDPAGFSYAGNFDFAPGMNAAETKSGEPVVIPEIPAAAAEIKAGTIPPAGYLSGENSREADLTLLYTLMGRLDQFIGGQIEISEEDLAAMELTITLLKARYNLP